MEENNKSKDYFLPLSILMAAVLVAGSIIYAVGAFTSGSRAGKENSNPKLAMVHQAVTKAISDRDVILGDPKAPVTFIEYGDYQCPFCAKFFRETEPLLRENYIKTGKIKMAFRNFQFLGAESVAAAQAAECAKDQGKFWSYHDALYQAEMNDGRENSGNLNRDLFSKIAQTLGLGLTPFLSCYDSGKYKDQVKKDIADAQAIGVDSTPVVFVNDQEVKGALPYSQFQGLIENALKGS